MKTYCLEVWGNYACFTRPEMKVERVSYDVITPSAARGIFDAILWKPSIRWQIEKIAVINPIRWTNLRRNEVGSVIPMRNVKTAMKHGRGALALYIDDNKQRQQRAGLFLRDVRYLLYAHFEILEKDPNNTPVKFSEMFERRASKGQCFNQPYLGTREFSANFQLADDPTTTSPINETRDLGWMLYDIDFTNLDNPNPLFFRAKLEQGVITVPAWGDKEVRG